MLEFALNKWLPKFLIDFFYEVVLEHNFFGVSFHTQPECRIL